jgi:hypothetical protein
MYTLVERLGGMPRLSKTIEVLPISPQIWSNPVIGDLIAHYHVSLADFPVPLPGYRISSLRKDERANSQQTLRRKV